MKQHNHFIFCQFASMEPTVNFTVFLAASVEQVMIDITIPNTLDVTIKLTLHNRVHCQGNSENILEALRKEQQYTPKKTVDAYCSHFL
jgi:hypothetical protein